MTETTTKYFSLLLRPGDFVGGPNIVAMYVDPVPGEAEPIGSGLVKNNLDVGTVDALTLYSTGVFSLDALRVGDTFDDVMPLLPAGDTNRDGMVDVQDLNLVRNNFGAWGRPGWHRRAA